MNNFFNIQRFSMLFKKHTIENSKSYFFSIATLTGILLILLGFMSYMNEGRLTQESQTIIFTIGLTFAGTIFTSFSFNDLSEKRKAVSYLTLPASQFEKYLVAWIYSYLIFQLVFIISFYAVDFLVVGFSSKTLEESNKVLDLFETSRKPYIATFIFLFFHGFVFLGSIFFKKAHFVKTAFVFFLSIAAIAIFNKFLLGILIKESKLIVSIPFTGFSFADKAQRYYVDYNSPTFFSFMVFFIIVGLLWLGAFHKLKEKEV